MRETYCQVVARLLEQNLPLRQAPAAQCGARARTIAFLVVAGTSILYIWDIQVTSLACVVRKRGLHLRNLLEPTSRLRFEYPVLAVVQRNYRGFSECKVNVNGL